MQSFTKLRFPRAMQLKTSPKSKRRRILKRFFKVGLRIVSVAMATSTPVGAVEKINPAAVNKTKRLTRKSLKQTKSVVKFISKLAEWFWYFRAYCVFLNQWKDFPIFSRLVSIKLALRLWSKFLSSWELSKM